MCVLIVEDKPHLAEAVRDGRRPEAIAAETTDDGGSTLEPLSITSYELGTDGSLAEPCERREPVLRLAPFHRERSNDGCVVALPPEQSAVLEVLVAAEELLERCQDGFIVSDLRRRFSEPWLVAAVPGVGCRTGGRSGNGQEDGSRG